MPTHQAGNRNRPLSPHLQIYRPQLTSVMSILHRMTGAALAVGTLLVTAILVSAAMGEDSYDTVSHYVKSYIGQFMIFGWSVALYYHLFNGIRHLLWDRVYLFKLENAYRSGYLVLLLTVIATGATWYCAYKF